jgi:O-antigen ligase
MQYAKLIAEQPHVVHNAYLELLTEDGAIGLALFLGAVLAALRAALRAASAFERAGDRASAALSRSVFVATLSFLTTSFFLSAEFNPQLWVLLAFGLTVLCVAEHVSAGPAAQAGTGHANAAGISGALTVPGSAATVRRAAMLD